MNAERIKLPGDYYAVVHETDSPEIYYGKDNSYALFLGNYTGWPPSHYRAFAAAMNANAARVQLLAKALQSIATNSYCDGCQEAKLVAKAALTEAGIESESK